MTSRRALFLGLFAACAAGMTAAQAQPAPPPLPYGPIPAPRVEVVPVPPPGRRVVWEPGHWHWNGIRYVWIGGRYIPFRRRYVHYVPGAWVWRGRWVWVPAHWG
jgi:hypothetical protein